MVRRGHSIFTSASSQEVAHFLAFIDAAWPSNLFPSCIVLGSVRTDSSPQLFMGLSDTVTGDFRQSPQDVEPDSDGGAEFGTQRHEKIPNLAMIEKIFPMTRNRITSYTSVIPSDDFSKRLVSVT